MKNLIKLTAVVVLILSLASMNKTIAQDVVKTNPKNTKLLCDTAGVRMVMVNWKPGEQLALHTHPVNEIYVLQGGQLTVSHKGGSTDVLNLKAGDHFQSPAEIAHTTKNTGTTSVRIILVEINK